MMEKEWVTVGEAASRLGMSPSWFKAWVKRSGIRVERRGRRPGVAWSTVEDTVAESRIRHGRLRWPEGCRVESF